MKEKVQTYIGNMKYSDMRREKLIKGASAVDTALLSIGAISAGVVGVVPASNLSLLGYETASNILMGTSVGSGAATGMYGVFNAGNMANARIRRSRERRVS